MIFSRRALQQRLTELRSVLKAETVDRLALRLNTADKMRLGAVWETVVLHALSRCGDVQNEVALSSGRRPDIHFEASGLTFVADVTAVSDESLENENPYRELVCTLEAAKTKLGLRMGGMDIQVRSSQEPYRSGTRTKLLLPPREQLQHFVKDQVVPVLREQRDRGERILRFCVNDSAVSFDITIDASRSPYTSGSFSVYGLRQVKDRGPLFNALKDKARQLQGASGLTGVIVGDAGCDTISASLGRSRKTSAGPIVEDIFRQYSSIGFVLLLGVRGDQSDYLSPRAEHNSSRLFVRNGLSLRATLEAFFDEMVKHLPDPTMTPLNGSFRARRAGYDLGHHGAYRLSNQTLRIGLREFTEIFAGLRTLADNGVGNVAAARESQRKPNPIELVVRRHLMEGRLPTSIHVIKGAEVDDDDWVELNFGIADPAISPFR
jgi:hypothetical protein